jgi:hypothetical protein
MSEHVIRQQIKQIPEFLQHHTKRRIVLDCAIWFPIIAVITMNMRKLTCFALAVVGAFLTFSLGAQENRSLALVVQSKGAPELDSSVLKFRELLATDMTSAGFEIIDPSVVAEVVGHYDEGSVARADEAAQSGKSLDALLNNNTTALRLAQNCGAAYLLHASLVGLSENKTKVTSYGLDTIIDTVTLRVAVKVVDGTTGASVIGKTFEVSDKTQLNEYTASVDDGVVDKLLAKASAQVSGELKTHAANKGGLETKAVASESSTLTLNVSIRGMAIPIVGKDEAGNFVVLQNSYPVEASGVIVQVDGLVLGSAPDTFNIAPGLHSLTLTRDDLKPVTRNIKVSEKGTQITVSMELNDEALAKWKDFGSFASSLKNNERLSEAQAEMMKGIAQMFRQSGYRIDLQHAANSGAPLVLDLSDGKNVNEITSGMDALGFGTSLVTKSAATPASSK